MREILFQMQFNIKLNFRNFKSDLGKLRYWRKKIGHCIIYLAIIWNKEGWLGRLKTFRDIFLGLKNIVFNIFFFLILNYFHFLELVLFFRKMMMWTDDVNAKNVKTGKFPLLSFHVCWPQNSYKSRLCVSHTVSAGTERGLSCRCLTLGV